MKNGNMSIVYGAIAVLSILLLLAYLLWEKKQEKSFLGLFACVCAVNCGYFLLSVSTSRNLALMANALSYLGAAYSMLVMLLIILDVCHISRKKGITALLVSVTTVMFLLAASGDWLGLYYRSVTLESIHGTTRLVKVYGPLHALYPIYLLSYFAIMVATIGYAAGKKLLASPKYAVFLAAAVLLNLGVWAIEQRMDVLFEFLSLSYIVTEVMLLLIYSILRDYGIVRAGGRLISVQMLASSQDPVEAGALPPEMEKLLRAFAQKAGTLSTAERRIFHYYLEGYEISDIPELAFISIHTVKKHNRSIYQKLDIASRDELMLYIELFRRCGRLEELSDHIVEAE